jgi:hypothetical protein
LKNPQLNSKGDAARYGAAANIPDKSIIGDALTIMLEEVIELN